MSDTASSYSSKRFSSFCAMLHSFFQWSGRCGPCSPSDFPVLHIGFMHYNSQLDRARCHYQLLGQERMAEEHSSRRSGMVITPAVLSPLFPAYLLSELLWLGEAAITTLCLKFISSGQSDSSERQNLWTIPELNKEGRRNAKGGGAIWPSGDREAKKLQTLAFDDLLWPWPYVSYQQVSGPCGAPHIQRKPTSPPMVPRSSTATITKAGAQFAPKCFTQKQCMWKKKEWLAKSTAWPIAASTGEQ